jgi:acyl carrier protein
MPIDEQIKSLISEISEVTAEYIKPTDTLTSVGIDSINLVQLIVSIEEIFDITFDDSYLNPANLSTVGMLIAMTKSYLGNSDNQI